MLSFLDVWVKEYPLRDDAQRLEESKTTLGIGIDDYVFAIFYTISHNVCIIVPVLDRAEYQLVFNPEIVLQ